VPRPRITLLTPACALLALAGTLAACGDDEESTGTDPTTAVTSTDPTTTEASATSAPGTTPSTSSPASTSSTTSTTGPTTTAPATTTSTTDPADADVVLRGDGLGPVRFGDAGVTVIEELSSRFGDPTSVSGWMATGLPPDGLPPCNYPEQQFVSWGDLAILIARGADGAELFRYYGYAGFDAAAERFPADLRTEQGIGLLDPIESAHDRVPSIEWDETEPATWWDPDNDLFGELITDRGVLIGSITAGDICAG
jgi:hypothetical protein